MVIYMGFFDKLKNIIKKDKDTKEKDLYDKGLKKTREEFTSKLNSLNVNKINYSNEGPTVILFVGVNGVGKTTSIAKIAN